jgi:hypothetical protein
MVQNASTDHYSERGDQQVVLIQDKQKRMSEVNRNIKETSRAGAMKPIVTERLSSGLGMASVRHHSKSP